MPPPTKMNPIKKPTCVGMVNPQKSGHRFMSNDLNLLETGEFSDVKIICGDRTWNCHQIIIATRCAWFQKALSGPFVEAQTRIIHIDDVESDLVDTMIRYIYSGGDLDLSKLDQTKGGGIFTSYIRVWILADYFLLKPLMKDAIEGLKGCCGEKLKIIADIKAHMGVLEQNALIRELADGVKTAFRRHPASHTYQRILIDYAFCCRLRFLVLDKFIDLLEKEHKFGLEVIIKCLRVGETPHIGPAGSIYPVSKAVLLDTKCRRCRDPQYKAEKWFHDWDTSAKKDPAAKHLIFWTCDKCVVTHGYPWEAMSSWKEV